ncbi:hypothetical protein [Kribbella sp. NPDC023855]|uniref:hypothetical protein n=1 Tax=Kribbella sp. NPDC023855 TaxID=3154698 RepID=UPI0033C392EB
MTDTELKERLGATVDGIEAPADLVHRVRTGGARRLRRRRFASLTATALSLVVLGGAGLVGPDLLDRSDQVQPAKSVVTDPYGFLLKGSTRGDLAKDSAYLRQVVEIWNKSHATSANADRGIFNDLRGEARVAWAGQTPGGKAAIVVQRAYLHPHDNIQLEGEGIQTLVGYVAEDAAGKQTLIADSYPAPGSGLDLAFVTGGRTKALVVMDPTGGDFGFSPERIYTPGGSTRKYEPLKFKDGVSVLGLPADVNLDGLRVSALPATTPQARAFEIRDNRPPLTAIPDNRLWKNPEPVYATWPMTDGADDQAKTANDDFLKALDSVSDPHAYGTAMSLWVGYGVTANGSRVLLGEQALDEDPTHIYAVLRSPDGKQTVVQGGVPDPKAALPVSIKLPDGQGWAVAQMKAELSYRYGDGAWSAPRKDTTLVPAGQDAEVRITLNGKTKTVSLD